MLRHIVGFLGKILNLIKTKIMKNKKIRIAGYVMCTSLVIFSAFSVYAANWTAPSRYELAEGNFNRAVEAEKLSIKNRQVAECNFVDVKLADHEKLGLDGKEIERLAKKKSEKCEGNEQ